MSTASSAEQAGEEVIDAWIELLETVAALEAETEHTSICEAVNLSVRIGKVRAAADSILKLLPTTAIERPLN